ncbi:MAG: lipoyl(octanoyl) transferase LipB [Planctomycetota bacterium]|nr:lipoyl(octanoyl) transferase LipB [Planctomycetota bacterium]
MTPLAVVQLGKVSYAAGLDAQKVHHAEVLAARDRGSPEPGRLLVCEHVPPVITVTRRPGAAGNVLAGPEVLRARGIEVAETDRGGDVTYHGPGQLVVYPILDLNTIGLNLHAYMRLLEDAVIDALRGLGVEGDREAGATGVWVREGGGTAAAGDGVAKLCAMGVRVRRWVTMHGLALNVRPDLEHFELIVPCGLAGRRVTSLEKVLGAACPDMPEVAERVTASLSSAVRRVREAAAG